MSRVTVSVVWEGGWDREKVSRVTVSVGLGETRGKVSRVTVSVV